MVKGRQGERVRSQIFSNPSFYSFIFIDLDIRTRIYVNLYTNIHWWFIQFHVLSQIVLQRNHPRLQEVSSNDFVAILICCGDWLSAYCCSLIGFCPGRSRTSTQTRRWSRSRVWTRRRKWRGTKGSAWRTSTRPRWRGTDRITVAFGEKFPGLMVTVVSLELSSSRISLPNLWYNAILIN